MSNKKTMPKKDRESNKTTIVIALLGLLGTVITAYFAWRASSRPTEVIISATQTAEAKPTASPTVTVLPASPPPATKFQELVTIQFDYSDTPANHGWSIVEGDSSSLTFEGVTDSALGSVLNISAPAYNIYALDYDLPPNVSEYGSLVNLVVNYYDEKASVYVYVQMTRNADEVQAGWLKLKIGNNQPLPSTSGEKEWLLYVTPEEFMDNNWVKVSLDLENAIQETFGRDGWVFDKLLKFRLRGNIGIDKIAIYMNVTK